MRDICLRGEIQIIRYDTFTVRTVVPSNCFFIPIVHKALHINLQADFAFSKSKEQTCVYNLTADTDVGQFCEFYVGFRSAEHINVANIQTAHII